MTHMNDDHFRRSVPLAPTDAERLELKREDAGFAFELNHPPAPRGQYVEGTAPMT